MSFDIERISFCLMLLFSFTSKVYSQDSALPKALRKGAVTREPGLNKFEGTWIWTSNERDTLKITFKKVLKAMPSETHFDVLVGQFIYVVKGKVVQDSKKQTSEGDNSMLGMLEFESAKKNRVNVSFTDLVTSGHSMMCFELLNNKTAKWYRIEWTETTYKAHPNAIPVKNVQWIFRKVSN